MRVANGTNSDCRGVTITQTITTTTSLASINTNRYTPQSNYNCYQAQTTYGTCSSTISNPITFEQVGFVASAVEMINGGSASVLDPGDKIVVNFNQAVNSAMCPVISDTVYADGAYIVVGSTVSSGGCSAQPMAVWYASFGSATNYKTWDGITFTVSSITASMVSINQGLQVAVLPTRDENIVVGIDVFGNVKGEVWNGSTWTLIPGTSLGSLGFVFPWAYAVAYEQQSGDVLIAFADASNTLKYATWNGTLWPNATAVSDYPTLAGAKPAKRVALASKPGSNEIAMAVTSNLSKTIAWIWNGSSWGSDTTLNSTGTQNTASAVAYESLTGRIMVTYSKGFGVSSAYYRIWNGSSWLAEGSTAAPRG